MKRYIYLTALFISFFNCKNDKVPIAGDTDFQIELNSEFKDATLSPLKEKDLKAFKGLDFFKYDSTFVVKAHIKRTPDSEFFNMKTTTSRVSKERVYGVLSFQLKGKNYKLNIYQADEQLEGYDDYLFLPFLDQTNGEESYAGGRYIDSNILDGDTMIIDFNTAYNPYCAYNEDYSCPIVPRENYLEIRIEAGVKKYNKG